MFSKLLTQQIKPKTLKFKLSVRPKRNSSLLKKSIDKQLEQVQINAINGFSFKALKTKYNQHVPVELQCFDNIVTHFTPEQFEQYQELQTIKTMQVKFSNSFEHLSKEERKNELVKCYEYVISNNGGDLPQNMLIGDWIQAIDKLIINDLTQIEIQRLKVLNEITNVPTMHNVVTAAYLLQLMKRINVTNEHSLVLCEIIKEYEYVLKNMSCQIIQQSVKNAKRQLFKQKILGCVEKSARIIMMMTYLTLLMLICACWAIVFNH